MRSLGEISVSFLVGFHSPFSLGVTNQSLFKNVTRINLCFESFTGLARRIFRWSLSFDAVYMNLIRFYQTNIVCDF